MAQCEDYFIILVSLLKMKHIVMFKSSITETFDAAKVKFMTIIVFLRGSDKTLIVYQT